MQRDKLAPVLLSIAAILVVIGVCGGGYFLYERGSQPKAAAVAVTVATSPRVGGNLGTFLAAYGSPMATSGGGFDYLDPCPDGKTWQLAVETVQSPTVIAVNGQLCDPKATLPASWRGVAESFLPADATPNGRTYDKIGGTYEYFYLSPSAKRQQDPANPPSDCNANPMPMGTVSLEGPRNGDPSWQVTLGGC